MSMISTDLSRNERHGRRREFFSFVLPCWHPTTSRHRKTLGRGGHITTRRTMATPNNVRVKRHRAKRKDVPMWVAV